MFSALIEKILQIQATERAKPAYIRFENLPQTICQALVCIEDHRFYSHPGVDLLALFRAFLTNVLNFRIVEGGSSITQQLVRSLVLTKSKFLRRKIHEVFLALLLERKLSKKDILELHLNTCFFLSFDNKDIYGIAPAAQALFGRPCTSLSLAEQTFLVALLGRPLSNRSSTTAIMRTIFRQQLIQRALFDFEKIGCSDFEMAVNEDILIFGNHKNALPIERIRDFAPRYIRPVYFVRPFLRLLKSIRRLIRLALAAWKYSFPVLLMSRKYDLPFSLIWAVISAESSFGEKAVSSKNAKGLMQLIDSTFVSVAEQNKKPWTLADIFKPYVNIEAGSLYLKEMLDYFGKKIEPAYVVHYALAAYNAGPHNIDKVIDLIEKNNHKKDWEGLVLHLPKITHRYMRYTIKYVESVTRAIKPTNFLYDFKSRKQSEQRKTKHAMLLGCYSKKCNVLFFIGHTLLTLALS